MVIFSQSNSSKYIAMAVFICVFLLSLVNLRANQADSTRAFDFTFDYTRFHYNDSLAYLEVFASLPRNMITYVEEDNRYAAKFRATVEIMKKDSVMLQNCWLNVNYADSTSEISASQQLFCLTSFSVSPDDYKLKFRIDDENSEKNAEYTVDLSIPPIVTDSLNMSDIQLATSIKSDTTKSIYVKNGLRVYPNPSRLYGIQTPIIYTYSEIYNFATPVEGQQGTYSIKYQIIDSNGNLTKDFPEKIKNKPGESAVEVNGVSVVALHSGTYILALRVTDLDNGAVVTKGEKFFVYRAGDFTEEAIAAQRQQETKGPGSAGLDAQRYNTMTEREIDKEFEYTRYVTTKDERRMYKKLNLDGKRQFIREFWAKRDPTPGTPDNEYKRTYLKSVETANRMFKGTFKEGWRTDRGRVLLVYGGPDEVERFPFSNENRAYEIWHFFSVQGGVDFIFVDKREMGEYELVHSTARGELYDPEWTRWINLTR